jgi:hypothetical protein
VITVDAGVNAREARISQTQIRLLTPPNRQARAGQRKLL